MRRNCQSHVGSSPLQCNVLDTDAVSQPFAASAAAWRHLMHWTAIADIRNNYGASLLLSDSYYRSSTEALDLQWEGTNARCSHTHTHTPDRDRCRGREVGKLDLSASTSAVTSGVCPVTRLWEFPAQSGEKVESSRHCYSNFKLSVIYREFYARLVTALNLRRTWAKLMKCDCERFTKKT